MEPQSTIPLVRVCERGQVEPQSTIPPSEGLGAWPGGAPPPEDHFQAFLPPLAPRTLDPATTRKILSMLSYIIGRGICLRPPRPGPSAHPNRLTRPSPAGSGKRGSGKELEARVLWPPQIRPEAARTPVCTSPCAWAARVTQRARPERLSSLAERNRREPRKQLSSARSCCQVWGSACACVRARACGHAHLPAAGPAKFFLLNVQATHPRFLARGGVPEGSSTGPGRREPGTASPGGPHRVSPQPAKVSPHHPQFRAASQAPPSSGLLWGTVSCSSSECGGETPGWDG